MACVRLWRLGLAFRAGRARHRLSYLSRLQPFETLTDPGLHLLQLLLEPAVLRFELLELRIEVGDRPLKLIEARVDIADRAAALSMSGRERQQGEGDDEGSDNGDDDGDGARGGE